VVKLLQDQLYGLSFRTSAVSFKPAPAGPDQAGGRSLFISRWNALITAGAVSGSAPGLLAVLQ